MNIKVYTTPRSSGIEFINVIPRVERDKILVVYSNDNPIAIFKEWCFWKII